MRSNSLVPVFERYLSIARQFCSSCESADKWDQRHFLSHIQGLLLDLYSHGRGLPETDSSSMEFKCQFERNDKEVQSMIAGKLPFACYWQALDPISPEESKLGMGDLLDDLGDIYTDLKRAILIYNLNQDEARLKAYWMLKFDFDYHLADHGMNAIKAIHDYMGKEGYNGW